MKYCSNCGNEMVDEAVVCVKCGRSVNQGAPAAPVAKQPSGMQTACKVFMIIGTVMMGFSGYLIPLAWCIPMTVSYFKKLKNGEPISTGFKVCSLLFVSLIGGILMLCDKEN